MQKAILCIWKWKERVAILISDKVELKTKVAIGNKERHFIMTKTSILKEDIRTVNIYAPSTGAPK